MKKIKVKLGQVWANPNMVHQIGEVVEVSPEVARQLVDSHGATALESIPDSVTAPVEDPKPLSDMEVVRQIKTLAELPTAKDPLQVTPSVVSNPKTTSLVNMVPDSRVDEENFEDYKAKKENAELFAQEKAAKEKSIKEAKERADSDAENKIKDTAARQLEADRKIAEAQERANKEAERKVAYEGNQKDLKIEKAKQGK